MQPKKPQRLGALRVDPSRDPPSTSRTPALFHHIPRHVLLSASSLTPDRPWTGVWTADPDISHFVFASAVTHAFADGWEVWTASEHERILGVAVWLPPGVDEKYALQTLPPSILL